MNQKIKYVPPLADVILLAPCEHLAAWEYSFEKTWKNPGKFVTDSGFTGIAFGDTVFDHTGTDGNFFTKS